MAEYIEREKALNDFDEWIETTGALPKGTSYYHECRACIEDVPAADVVEVVRCKDCRFRGREDCAMFYRCDCGEQHTWETDNDFCSYGERRINDV